MSQVGMDMPQTGMDMSQTEMDMSQTEMDMSQTGMDMSQTDLDMSQITMYNVDKFREGRPRCGYVPDTERCPCESVSRYNGSGAESDHNG